MAAIYSKPTSVPHWADSSINIVEPSEAKKSEGWLFEEVLPSSYENWKAKLIGDWFYWFNERFADGADADHFEIKSPDTGNKVFEIDENLYVYLRTPTVVGSYLRLSTSYINSTLPIDIDLTTHGSDTAGITARGKTVSVGGRFYSGSDSSSKGIEATGGTYAVHASGAYYGIYGASNNHFGCGVRAEGYTDHVGGTGLSAAGGTGVTTVGGNGTLTYGGQGVTIGGIGLYAMGGASTSGGTTGGTGVYTIGGVGDAYGGTGLYSEGCVGGTTDGGVGIISVGGETTVAARHGGNGLEVTAGTNTDPAGIGGIGGIFLGGYGGNIGGIGITSTGGEGNLTIGAYGISTLGGGGGTIGGHGINSVGGEGFLDLGGSGIDASGGEGGTNGGIGGYFFGGPTTNGTGGIGLDVYSGLSTSGRTNRGVRITQAHLTDVAKTAAALRLVPQVQPNGGALKGDIIYNSATDKLQVYNGAWVDLH